MKNLIDKIQMTRLFSDQQKIDLIAMLDRSSDDDKRKLEQGIDQFDHVYGEAIVRHARKLESLIVDLYKSLSPQDRAKNTEAVDQMNLGLTMLAR